jgi:hypothetical protein
LEILIDPKMLKRRRTTTAATHTKDVACAMLECILSWTENTAPPAVVAHVQEIIIIALPADAGSISDMSSQVLIDAVRPPGDGASRLTERQLQALM